MISPSFLRTLAPPDAPALNALFHRLTPQEIRWRFGHALTALPPELCARWCDPDGHRHLAWAIASPTGLHGVARAFVEGDRAEFAVLVEQAHAGKGGGTLLAHRLLADLDTKGVRETVVQVACDNHRMLRFATKLGFQPDRRLRINPDPTQRHLCRPAWGLAGSPPAPTVAWIGEAPRPS